MANEHINLPGIIAATPAPLPLTPEQLSYLHAAGDAHRAIRRTAAVANFSGITTLIICLGSAVFTAFGPDLMGVFATLVLGTVGTVELVGRQRLLRGEANACRMLAWNQLGFLGAIIVYCCIQMARFSLTSITASLPPELGTLDPQTQGMIRGAYHAFYWLLIGLSIVFQGGLAWYYIRREKYLTAFRNTGDAERQLLLKIAP